MEIKNEAVDDDMPEILEASAMESKMEPQSDPEMIIPDSNPSTSYTVTPLHRVVDTYDDLIGPSARLADMDEFHLFAMNVASQLRALPLNVALQAQVEIQTILAQKRLQTQT